MAEIAAKDSITRLCARLNVDVMDINFCHGCMVSPMFRVKFDENYDDDSWYATSTYEIEVYDWSDNSWMHYYGSDNPMSIKRQLRAMQLFTRELVYNALNI